MLTNYFCSYKMSWPADFSVRCFCYMSAERNAARAMNTEGTVNRRVKSVVPFLCGLLNECSAVLLIAYKKQSTVRCKVICC